MDKGDSDTLEGVDTTANMYDKEYIKTASVDEQLGYRTFHMMELVNKMAEAGIDHSKLFNGATKKDQEPEKVFFRDILLSNAMEKKGGLDSKAQYSIDAFEGLSEDDMDPYLWKVKEGDETDPLFLMSTYDTKAKEEVVVGFRFDEDRKLRQLPGTFSEKDVMGSESGKARGSVYAMSPDGCNGGDNMEKQSRCGGGGGAGTNSGNVVIEYAKIKEKKESWLEKGDVQYNKINMRSELIYGLNYTSDGEEEAICCNDSEGDFFAHVNNKEVGKNRLFNRYLTGSTKTSVFYVIFEYDKWPAEAHEFEKEIYGGSYKVGWRSWNTNYDEFSFTTDKSRPRGLPYGIGLKRSNNDIEYNIK